MDEDGYPLRSGSAVEHASQAMDKIVMGESDHLRPSRDGIGDPHNGRLSFESVQNLIELLAQEGVIRGTVGV